MSVESVCAAYVRGEIEVDELERRLERAVATEAAGVRPRPAVKQVKPWPSEAHKAFVLEFARRHKGPRAFGYAAQVGGMTWTDAPGGYAVPLMLAKGLSEGQRAAVLAAELRDIEADSR